jgi:hypothetical protein
MPWWKRLRGEPDSEPVSKAARGLAQDYQAQQQ